MKFIPAEQYAKVLEVVPILCVDLVIVNEKGEYLLVKRKNHPMKGRWWTVGGRVWKGESLTEAALRKGKEELGVKVKLVMPLGFYEEEYKVSPFPVSSVHTTTVMFLATPPTRDFKVDQNHSKWKWAKRLPAKLSTTQPFNLLTQSRKLLRDYE